MARTVLELICEPWESVSLFFRSRISGRVEMDHRLGCGSKVTLLKDLACCIACGITYAFSQFWTTFRHLLFLSHGQHGFVRVFMTVMRIDTQNFI